MASGTINNGENLFVKCKLERDESRSENIDLLTNTINNSNTTDDAKIKAEEMLINISDNIEKEINIENIIKLKVPIKNATHYRMSSISILFFKRVIYTFNAFKDYFMFSIAVIIS